MAEKAARQPRWVPSYTACLVVVHRRVKAEGGAARSACSRPTPLSPPWSWPKHARGRTHKWTGGTTLFPRRTSDAGPHESGREAKGEAVEGAVATRSGLQRAHPRVNCAHACRRASRLLLVL